MMTLGIVGKQCDHTGLHEVFTQSPVIIKGSVGSILSGKMYNTEMRVNKIINDVLKRWVIPYQDIPLMGVLQPTISGFANLLHTY